MIGKIQNYPVNFGTLYKDNYKGKLDKTLGAISNGNRTIQKNLDSAITDIEVLSGKVGIHLDGGRTMPYSSPNSAYFLKLSQRENSICGAKFKPDATPDECEKELADFVEQYMQDTQFGYTFAAELLSNPKIKFYLSSIDRDVLTKRIADFIDRDPEVAHALSETFEAVEKFSEGRDVKFHIWQREDAENTPCIKFGLWDKNGEREPRKTGKRNKYYSKYKHMNVNNFIAETLVPRGVDAQTKIDSLRKFNEMLA